MPKALITGINGFVGPYLKDELEKNHYQVFGLDRSAGQMEENRFFLADITNKLEVETAIKSLMPDFVFHLAGFSSPYLAEKDPELVKAINVGGTKNLLEATAQLTKPPRILIVSSSHVYGDPRYLPIDEKHPLLGYDAYAQSRLEQEELVFSYKEKLPWIIARSFNHTGPRQGEDFVVPKIVKQIVESKAGQRGSLKCGNINVRRDISDVRDVTAAYRLLAEQDKNNLVCNVCRGESISLKEIIESVKVLAQLTDIPTEIDPRLVRVGEAKEVCGDNSLLKSLTGWKIEYSYAQLLEDIFIYWKQKILINKI